MWKISESKIEHSRKGALQRPVYLRFFVCDYLVHMSHVHIFLIFEEIQNFKHRLRLRVTFFELYDSFLSVYPIQYGKIFLSNLEQSPMPTMQQQRRPPCHSFIQFITGIGKRTPP